MCVHIATSVPFKTWKFVSKKVSFTDVTEFFLVRLKKFKRDLCSYSPMFGEDNTWNPHSKIGLFTWNVLRYFRICIYSSLRSVSFLCGVRVMQCFSDFFGKCSNNYIIKPTTLISIFVLLYNKLLSITTFIRVSERKDTPWFKLTCFTNLSF